MYIGRLRGEDIERYDVAIRTAKSPAPLCEGVLWSGEMHEQLPYEAISPVMRVERNGQLVQDTFIGEQTVIANVKDRGLAVVTSCSHRGVVGICQHAARVAGVAKIHALEVDYIVPQHCTGIEAVVALAIRLRDRMVVSSVGSTFMFGERS